MFWEVLVPQSTEVPHRTLKALLPRVPQTTELPHTTDVPCTVVVVKAAVPHTTEVPQHTDPPQIVDESRTSDTVPVSAL